MDIENYVKTRLKNKYEFIEAAYYALSPIENKISGQKAFEYFTKSNISRNLLAQCWKCADYDRDGSLSRPEFYYMSMLVEMVKDGIQLPQTCPKYLIDAVQNQLFPKIIPLAQNRYEGISNLFINESMPENIANPETPLKPFDLINKDNFGSNDSFKKGHAQKQSLTIRDPLQDLDISRMNINIPANAAQNQNRPKIYEEVFKNLCNNSPIIPGKQCKEIFVKSGLSLPQLAQIWQESDIDRDGALTLNEFIRAFSAIERLLAPNLFDFTPFLRSQTLTGTPFSIAPQAPQFKAPEPLIIDNFQKHEQKSFSAHASNLSSTADIPGLILQNQQQNFPKDPSLQNSKLNKSSSLADISNLQDPVTLKLRNIISNTKNDIEISQEVLNNFKKTNSVLASQVRELSVNLNSNTSGNLVYSQNVPATEIPAKKPSRPPAQNLTQKSFKQSIDQNFPPEQKNKPKRPPMYTQDSVQDNQLTRVSIKNLSQITAKNPAKTNDQLSSNPIQIFDSGASSELNFIQQSEATNIQLVSTLNDNLFFDPVPKSSTSSYLRKNESLTKKATLIQNLDLDSDLALNDPFIPSQRNNPEISQLKTYIIQPIDAEPVGKNISEPATQKPSLNKDNKNKDRSSAKIESDHSPKSLKNENFPKNFQNFTAFSNEMPDFDTMLNSYQEAFNESLDKQFDQTQRTRKSSRSSLPANHPLLENNQPKSSNNPPVAAKRTSESATRPTPKNAANHEKKTHMNTLKRMFSRKPKTSNNEQIPLISRDPEINSEIPPVEHERLCRIGELFDYKADGTSMESGPATTQTTTQHTTITERTEILPKASNWPVQKEISHNSFEPFGPSRLSIKDDFITDSEMNQSNNNPGSTIHSRTSTENTFSRSEGFNNISQHLQIKNSSADKEASGSEEMIVVDPPMEVIAVRDFKSSETDFCFKKGDVLIVSFRSGDSYYSEIGADCDWFPMSYVQIKDDAPVVQKSVLKKSYTLKGFRVAIYPNVAEELDEISFEVGDVLNDVEDLDEWIGGYSNGKMGIYPKDYTKIMTEFDLKKTVRCVKSYLATNEYELSVESGDVLGILKENTSGWTLVVKESSEDIGFVPRESVA